MDNLQTTEMILWGLDETAKCCNPKDNFKQPARCINYHGALFIMPKWRKSFGLRAIKITDKHTHMIFKDGKVKLDDLHAPFIKNYFL